MKNQRKSTTRKLTLNRHTLRRLTGHELSRVAAGGDPGTGSGQVSQEPGG